MVDSQILGDRQGILRGTSMRVVINGDFCHRVVPFTGVLLIRIAIGLGRCVRGV